MLRQLALGAGLWLLVLAVYTAHHLARLAPILRYPLAHAAVVVAAAGLASACAIGLVGWLSALGWPTAAHTVGDGCANGGGWAAWLGGGGGCVHAYALLCPLVVVPVTIDAAFVLAHALESCSRERSADVAEERFAHTMATAWPRLLAAASAAAAAPLGAATAAHVHVGGLAPAAPVLQLAASVSLGVVCAHALVLTLVWSAFLSELRGEVRVLLQRSSDSPDVATAKAVHATLRRDVTPRVLAVVATATIFVAAIGGFAHLRTSTELSQDLPRNGRAAAYHQMMHAAAGGVPRPLKVEISAVGGRPVHMGDEAHCRALMAAHATLRTSAHVIALSSWLDALVEHEGSNDCAHLAAAARDGALERLLLRRPDLASDLLVRSVSGGAGGGHVQPSVVLATRWHATLQLPSHTPHAASAVLGLQAALVVAAASEDHTNDPIDEAYAVDGGGHFPPASIALGGEGIAVLELARRAPALCLQWALFAILGAAAAMLLHTDPLGVVALFTALGGLAILQLGLLAVLPPPMGAGQLAWVVLASTAGAHAPTLALQTIVTDLAARPGGRPQSTGDELGSLQHVTPPAWRAAITSVVALAPLALLAPMGFLRAAATLVLLTVVLAAGIAIIGVPLLHVALRRPPPPPPPPPPRPPPRRPMVKGFEAGEAPADAPALFARLLRSIRMPRFGGGGSRDRASERTACGGGVPSYGTSGAPGGHGLAARRGGSCLESWQDAGTLPVGGSVSGMAPV